MSDIKFNDLDTSEQETVLMSLADILEDDVKMMLEHKLGVGAKGYTFSHAISVHDAPITSFGMSGNPRRVIHNAMLTLLALVEQEEDYSDLAALMLDNGSLVPPREAIAQYINAAEQMNRLAKILSLTLDARPESGAHPH